ncbi:MAG: hypothetical protein HYY06_11995 [Deltaproteobacteria bacterium]|nr:hypothetical protein [Deltaproteobacteria bacterium]
MRRWSAVAVALVISVGQGARGDGLVPGPGEPGHDPDLAAKAEAFDLQLHTFMTPPLGWGLEAYVPDPGMRAAIDEFFASGAEDFEAHTGLHPYEALGYYEEMGDLGMFGGVQAAGDAFRYAVLRDGGAPADEVDAARAALIRAMEGLSWYTRVTGVPGAMARGLQRITPEPGDPPLPGEVPSTTPLFDAEGNPQPADKSPTWREDASGELPFLIWLDDTSKDQVDGYVFALGAVYDVVAGDPTIPADAIQRLVDDALAIGRSLMRRVLVAPDKEVDLVLVDADGRPTTFHDLSAEEIVPGLVLDAPVNGFNGWMGMSIVRTLYHITGDEELGRFYYEELVGNRGYLDVTQESIALMYFGNETNYSNVNMAFVAAYGLLRYESDPEVGAQIREILGTELYAPGVDRQARGLGQSFFDFIYAAFRPAGATGSGEDARSEGLVTLQEFPAPPTWSVGVTNCDEAEIASLDCTGIDGTPLPLSPDPGRGGGVVATGPLPMRIRPRSNFEWRSDPHTVNGDPGDRLDPGGDFHAAYWMGRFLEATSDGTVNISPIARPAPAASDPDADAGPEVGTDAGTPDGADAAAGVDAGTSSGGDDGCACRSGGGGRPTAWAVILVAVASLLGRRRGTATRSSVALRFAHRLPQHHGRRPPLRQEVAQGRDRPELRRRGRSGRDLDGHASEATGGDDCDDGDDAAFPGAPDAAGDGIDRDCDGADG